MKPRAFVPFVTIALASALVGCSTPASTAAAPAITQTVTVTVTQTQTGAASGGAACAKALDDGDKMMQELTSIIRSMSTTALSLMQNGANDADTATITTLDEKIKVMTNTEVPVYSADKAACLGGG